MKTLLFPFQFVVLFLVSFTSCTVAQAVVVIETVSVGNAGNANDTTGFGRVDYAFNIGKYEVTNTQYVEFLNSADPQGTNSLGLYNAQMTTHPSGGILRDTTAAAGSRYRLKSGRGNNPVIYVSEYDAMRFSNWMHNGQNGITETGTYSLLGGTTIPTNGPSIARNSDATWALASENEWYKAAYHRNDGVTGNYTRFPTGANIRPNSDVPPGTSVPDPTNVANVFRDDGITNGYNDGYAVTGSRSFPTGNGLVDVGSYAQTSSAYGAFDMAGNVVEYNETMIGSSRGIRGDSFWTGSFGLLLDDSNSRFIGVSPGFEDLDVGFRLVQMPSAVPEPAALSFLGLVAGIGVVVRRRVKRNSDQHVLTL
ncbi:MAG: SUMF1/EgtB/PvdO family nonheme iron enzyme [Planctomycetota bacterium]